MNVRVEVAGEGRLQIMLDRAAQAVSDWSEFFEIEARPSIDEHETEVFETEGQSLGQKWAPLALSTVKAKARSLAGFSKGRLRLEPARAAAFGAVRILFREGRLMRAASNPLAAGASETVQPLSYVRRVHLPYAAAHQYGTARIPARPFLAFSEALVRRLEASAAAWLESQAGGTQPT